MSRPGSWKEFERFGRFEATETLDEELDLPEGEVLISVVGLGTPERVQVELAGPDGPVALERATSTLQPRSCELDEGRHRVGGHSWSSPVAAEWATQSAAAPCSGRPSGRGRRHGEAQHPRPRPVAPR
jgi:hypothetical protein